MSELAKNAEPCQLTWCRNYTVACPIFDNATCDM